MAFEGLSGRLSEVFKKLKGRGKVKESDIKEVMREVRMALLEADVNYKVAKDFVASVSDQTRHGQRSAREPDPRPADHQDRQ